MFCELMEERYYQARWKEIAPKLVFAQVLAKALYSDSLLECETIFYF